MSRSESSSTRLFRIAFLASLIAIFVPAAGSAFAQGHINVARGFNSETPFQVGDIDAVNGFNGNLVVTVPIGQEYRVGGNLAYSFKLVYNGQAWAYRQFSSAGICLDMGDFPMTCTDGDSWIDTIPGSNANAALGWQLTLGELRAPNDHADGLNSSNVWTFHTADGSSHTFYKVLDPSHLNTSLAVGASGSDVFGYTRDSTYMRLRGKLDETPNVGWFAVMTVEQPNGTSYVFRSVRLSEQPNQVPTNVRYFLESIEDAFGNRLEIQYLYQFDLGGIPLYQADPFRNPIEADIQQITEFPKSGGAGRIHTIRFADEAWYQTKLTEGHIPSGHWQSPGLLEQGYVGHRKIIKSVMLTADTASGGQATYTLQSDFQVINESCDASIGWEDRRVAVRLLTGIDGPAGFHYGFAYPELGAPDACSDTAGHLIRVDLPTGASIHYELTRRNFPQVPEQSNDERFICGGMGSQSCSKAVSSRVRGGGDHRPPFLESTAVAKRKVIDPYGATATHVYSTASRCMSQNAERFQELVVNSDAPTGERTLSYFVVDMQDRLGTYDYPADPSEYALPYSRMFDPAWAPGYHLSTETMASACTAFPGATSTSTCGVPNACDALVMRRTYVKYDIDGSINSNTDVDGPPEDGARLDLNRRLAGTITVTRTFTGTQWVDVECSPGVPCYTKVEYSDFDGLGHYRKETRSSNNGGLTRTTTTDHQQTIPQPADPWLFGQYDGTSVQEGAGVELPLSEVCWDTKGFMTRKRAFRGLSTGRYDAGETDLLIVYARNDEGNLETESHYGVAASFTTCTGTPGTATVTTHSEWSNGSLARQTTTGFNYKTTDLDIDATTGLATASRDPKGRSTSYDYDLLGRLKAMHPPSEASMFYEYHLDHSPVHVIAKQAQSETGPSETESHYYYDGKGRLIQEKKRMPSGWATVSHTYDLAGRKASVTVPTFTTSSAYSALVGVPSTTFTYDGLGRTTRVVAPDGSATDTTYVGDREIARSNRIATERGVSDRASQQVFTTTELLDGFGRLSEVREPLPNGNATYVSTTYGYDFADRLTSVNNGQTRTFTYDRTGLLLTESHPERPLTTFTYTPGGRLSKKIIGTGVSLSHHYDLAERLTEVKDTIANRTLKTFTFDTDGSTTEPGSLVAQSRSNYFSNATYTVTDRFRYHASTGRVSSKETSITTPTGTRTATQSYSYDTFGQPAAIQFPVCSNCGPFASATRNLPLTWRDGLLTSISGAATSIEYAPTGATRKVVHATRDSNPPTGVVKCDDEEDATTPTPPYGVVDCYQQDAFGMARPLRIKFRNTRGCALILRQALSMGIAKFGVATFSIEVAPGSAVQWYQGISGDLSTPIANATSTTYSTPGLSQTTSYWARVTAPDGGCQENSLTVTATVCEPPVVQTPDATAATTVYKNVPLTFSVTVAGSVTYEWFTRIGSNGTETIIPGNGPQITYTPTAAATNRQIVVRIIGACGTVIRIIAILNVIETVQCTADFDPVYTDIFPRNYTVMPNEHTSYKAVVRLSPAAESAFPKRRYSFRWIEDGVLKVSSDLVWKQGDAGNPASDTTGPFRTNYTHIFVNQSILRLEAWVSCYDSITAAENAPAGISATIVKQSFGVMNGHCPTPDLSVKPASVILTPGEPVTLTADVVYPDAIFRWYKGESGNTNSEAFNGETSQLVVTDPGTYWLRVSSECGNYTDSPTITVSRGSCNPVRILRDPAGATIDAGSPVALSVDAAGIPSPNYYLWFESYNGPGEGSDTSIAETNGKPAITVAPLETTDYYVRVGSGINYKNDCSISDSRIARVHVTSCSDITLSQPQDAVLRETDALVTLSVQATSAAALKYQWYMGDSGDMSQPIDPSIGDHPTLQLTWLDHLQDPAANKFWVKVSIVTPPGMPKRCAVDSRTVNVCRLPRVHNPLGTAFSNSVPQLRRDLHVGVTGDNLTYEWYEGDGNASIPDTSRPLSSQSDTVTVYPTRTTKYWVKIRSTCAPANEWIKRTTEVSVCPFFTNGGTPTATKTLVTSGTTTTLTVTVDRGDLIQWFQRVGTATPVKFAEGPGLVSVVTPPITQQTKFFARAISGICDRDTAEITIDVCTSPRVHWSYGNTTRIAKGEVFWLNAGLAPGETASPSWYRGTTSGDVAGSTLVYQSSFAYQVANVQTTSSYWVRALDQQTGCYSDTSVHTVNVCIPTILTQPQSVTINSNTSTTLSVTTDNLAGVTYQWYSGQPGDTSNPLVGKTANTLLVTPTATTTYWVRVTGCPSPLTPVTRDSQAATVTICQVPTITTQPASNWQTTPPTTLSVTATGTELTYQWYKGLSGDMSLPQSSTTSSLNVSPSVTTNYWVRVSGRCGTPLNSVTAKVSVRPSINSQPIGGPITKGTTRALTVVASGTELTYQWYQRPATGSPIVIAGATSASYTPPAVMADVTYYVRVYSGAIAYDNSQDATLTVCLPREIETVNYPSGVSGSLVTLRAKNAVAGETFEWYRGAVGNTSDPLGGDTVKNVYPAATTTYWLRTKRPGCDADSAPYTANVCYPNITAQPEASSVIAAGTTKTLSVAVTGTAPLVYQWYQGAAGVTTTPVGTNSNTFTTPALTASTSYWVRISTNAAVCSSKFVNSQVATVTVCQPPVITAQPQASNQLPVGVTYTISVTATGEGLHYQWYIGDAGVTTTPVGTDSNQISVTANQTKKYWVRVTGTCGVANSVAALQSVKPRITSHPQNADVCGIGGTATFSVTASGADGYKWYRESELVGTERILTIVVTDPSLDYKVVVTSGDASTTSQFVSVNMLPQPTLNTFTATQETATRWLLQTNISSADTGLVKYRFYEGALGDTTTLLSDQTTTYLRVYPSSRPKTYWVSVYYIDTGCGTNRAVTIP